MKPIKFVIAALALCLGLSAQTQENINVSGGSTASVGRVRNITEAAPNDYYERPLSLGKYQADSDRSQWQLGDFKGKPSHNPIKWIAGKFHHNVIQVTIPAPPKTGKHNLVQVVARHPKAGCAVTAECGEIFYAHANYNLVVNAGLNWLADIMGNTSTPAVNAQCNYIGLSNGAGTPAAGDTALATTVGTEITTNGLTRAQGTYAHTSNATTFTIAKTFTATGAQSAQAGAVFTAVSAGTMCYEDTFTSATLATNDTLTVTWTITI